MNTTEVAELLGTEPRRLRQFLRSSASSFVAVGSSSRYDFTDRDLPTLRKRFGEWTRGARTTPPANGNKPKLPKPAAPAQPTQRQVDMAVWVEEEEQHGPIVLPDLRDPVVRAEVRRVAREQEERLMLQLMAAGLHITQLGDR